MRTLQGSNLGWVHEKIFHPIRWTALCSMRPWRASSWTAQFSVWVLPKNWCIHQVDIKAAFLHTSLPNSKFIYVRLPKFEGIKSTNEEKILLQKSLYGLRQAPNLWYEHFSKTIPLIGFRRSRFSYCFFYSELTARKSIFHIVCGRSFGRRHQKGSWTGKDSTIGVLRDLRSRSLFALSRSQAWKVRKWNLSIPEGLYRANYPES